MSIMKIISSREAAKRLGLHPDTLAHYVAVGKVPAPTILDVGTAKLHAWTEKEIENVRKLLPKIANGRKTRWQRQRGRDKQKTQPKSAAFQKKRRTKKK